MFPFGVKAPGTDSERDARGPDTVDRVLLHGARHHDRDAVFAHRQGCAWVKTPDWRADRLSIRIALVLQEKLGVAAGDAVGIGLRPSLELALVERAVWGIGAVSVPLASEISGQELASVLHQARPAAFFLSDETWLDRLPAAETGSVVLLGGPSRKELPTFDDVLEAGGALDTPERASRFRAGARAVPPGAPASLESLGEQRLLELTHGRWASTVETLLRRFPARPKKHFLISTRPDATSRAVIYAGWADGLTETWFAGDAVDPHEVGEADVVFGRTPPAGSPSFEFATLTAVERDFGSDRGGTNG